VNNRLRLSGYYKTLYVYDDHLPKRAVIRNYAEADFKELIEVQQESFPPPYPAELWWNEQQLMNHIQLFPLGVLCIEVEGVIAGSMTGLLVEFDPAHPHHTWAGITDDGYIRNHNPDGNTLYVVDICVRPVYRKLGLGQMLMQAMYEVVVHLGLKRLVGCGRMPRYHQYAAELSAEAYVQRVLTGEIHDPVITFLLRCGRTPLAVVPGYLEDEESLGNGLLMEWRNPFMMM
jgi:ribosomal protein S18 acetylase RimI-like enzyme